MIVQLGGQTPLKLAAELQAAGRADPRHLARQHRPGRGSRAVRGAGRASSASSSPRTALRAAARRRSRSPSGSAIRCFCGRPTCLADAGWRSSTGPAQLDNYIATAVAVSGSSPVLIDRYLRDAIEVDVDAICDGTDVVVVRRAAAYRGSGRAFGRQRLLDPALQPVRRDRRRDRAADPRAGAGAARSRG